MSPLNTSEASRNKLNKIFKYQFIRFVVSGTTATLVDISLLYIITEYIGLWYLLSSIFSFLAGSITHFTISRHWVFNNRQKTFWRQYKSFFIIHLGGLAINTTGLYLLVQFLHIYYLLAKLMVVVLGVGWTFTANKKITFKTVTRRIK